MRQKYSFVAALGLLCACLVSTGAFAQTPEAWPTKPITMVVPFPPGGVADTVGRPVAEALSRSLGQSVIVENKAGAGGGIGMAAVARAKPDGYTILMALSSISIIPEADKVVGREQSFQLNQLKPIARFTADPTVLVVRADSPWKDYKAFVAAMRANPGKYNFGSSGNYGTMHVPMEMLKSSEKFYMVHIPYTGAGPAIVGLLGGQVDAIATGPSSIVQQIKAGKVRALAHWGDGRLASMPEVPSFKEMGVKIEFSQWAGLFVPSATPDYITNKLREAAKQAANDERVRAVINGAGSPIQYMDAPEFKAYWDKESAQMGEVVKKIGKVE
ncbi:tripartite tricarboxylate transporter substrate binding protein [Polynucleobacter sp. JS-JIR-II-b4]|uniref:Bug family tripartite tricarboxylate transporter substrate binding protein n=1 Tax=Polynucleobacter sp. JS-JIR-II-b4 TaxID=1758390 RepID=UPI001BFD4666|nr:tripartite tricarboxylate transporter substrate binding protein [Polynucleobacter sp. JS-JIR-II-b4]QWE03167.1 tripartite tricarboxylate transporter substrate binding protein [Polynucleobacter sp. JS-JIR-II-b4]